MAKFFEEFKELGGGWQLLVAIGLILLIKAIFAFGFSISFSF
jgi:hypothetical protein